MNNHNQSDKQVLEQISCDCSKEVARLEKRVNLVERRLEHIEQNSMDTEQDIQNLYRRAEGWPMPSPYDDQEDDDD